MSFFPLRPAADASAPLAFASIGSGKPVQRLTLERCLLLALAVHVLGFALFGFQRFDRVRPAAPPQEEPLTLRLRVAPPAEIEPTPVARPAPLLAPVSSRESTPAVAAAPARERTPARPEHQPLVAVPQVVPEDKRVPLQATVAAPAAPAAPALTDRVDLTGALVAPASPVTPGPATGKTASASGPASGLDLRVKIDTRTLAQTARATLPAPLTGPQKLTQGVDSAARPDCLTAYSAYGLLSVIPLVHDAITGTGCK